MTRRHEIRVIERDPEDATYGWGVVFSDVALSFVRDIAPEVYGSIARDAVRLRRDGGRAQRTACQARAQHLPPDGANRSAEGAARPLLQVGVRIEFGRACEDVSELDDCELVVAADGANSTIRTRYKEHFQPALDERPNWLAWYGTTRLFRALSLIFRQNGDGLVIAHAYQYSDTHSTFLVEATPNLP